MSRPWLLAPAPPVVPQKGSSVGEVPPAEPGDRSRQGAEPSAADEEAAALLRRVV